MEVVKIIYSADRTHMVEIFQREDGTFGFEANRWSNLEFEKSWVPYSRSISFCESKEIAEKEAGKRIDWMIAERKSRAEANP